MRCAHACATASRGFSAAHAAVASTMRALMLVDGVRAIDPPDRMGVGG